MRLVRSIQIAIGIATTGGAALMLSGSALAADAGTVTTSQKTTTNLQIVSIETQEVSSVGTGVAAVSASHEQQSLVGQPEVATASKTESALVEQPKDTLGSAADSVSQVVASQQEAGKAALAILASEGQSAGQSASGQPFIAVAVPVIGQTTKADTAIFAPKILVVQPKITNRTAAVADLAASLPSAAIPMDAPMPAESTGLLSNLTTQMASTVVPEQIVPVTAALPELLTLLVVCVTVLVAVRVFAYSYGAWLRRGGFATAARSDAGASLLFPFATPSLLGSVELPSSLPGPIFNGVRNERFQPMFLVPNAFRKEEMS